VFITVNVATCTQPSLSVVDTLQKLCNNDTINILVLGNDSDPNGDSLTVTSIIQPPTGSGTLTLNGNVVTYQPGTTLGAIQMGYVVCDNGSPSLCDTGTILVDVIACNISVTDIYDTTCIGTDVRVCLNNHVTSNNPWTIGQICSPSEGTASITSDSCFTYSPSQGFTGTDNFCIVVCDEGGHCDTATVHITTIDCLIQAVDEPCNLDTTLINTAITLNVLDNDIIPLAGDTKVSLLLQPVKGSAGVNTNHPGTYNPKPRPTRNENFP